MMNLNTNKLKSSEQVSSSEIVFFLNNLGLFLLDFLFGLLFFGWLISDFGGAAGGWAGSDFSDAFLNQLPFNIQNTSSSFFPFNESTTLVTSAWSNFCPVAFKMFETCSASEDKLKCTGLLSRETGEGICCKILHALWLIINKLLIY